MTAVRGERVSGKLAAAAGKNWEVVTAALSATALPACFLATVLEATAFGVFTRTDALMGDTIQEFQARTR
jgi:hypothetical protein